MKKRKTTLRYVKTFRSSSIFWRNFILVILLLLIPFAAFSTAFYTHNLRVAEDETFTEKHMALETEANILDDTIRECDMLTSYLASNADLQSFMLSSVQPDSFASISRLAKNIPLIYEYVDSVYIYSEYNDAVLSNEVIIPYDTFSDKGWFGSVYKDRNKAGSLVLRKKNDTYPYFITIIKPVFVANEIKGAVIMNLSSQTLFNTKISDEFKADSQIFVTYNNRIMLSTNIDYFNIPLSETGLFPYGFRGNTLAKNKYNDNVILSHGPTKRGFTYISVYPYTIYHQRVSGMAIQLLIVFIILFILGIIFAYLASLRFYAPLEEIVSFLDTGAPGADIGEGNENELKYIINSIRHHIENKEKMDETLEERMQMLKKAQYDMLQAQINPHFLYNTLETINWMAFDMSGSDPENPVSKSLLSLAAFFRNTLSSTGYLIPIESEIQYTHDYVNILSLRYGELFDIEWNIDDEINTYTTIKICLQPVIENAVYHGLKPKKSKGKITVSGRLENGNIVFAVHDNGIGIDADTLKKINTSMRSNVYSESSTHIGLDNVNKRIKIIFGNEYGIHVESEPGKWTTVYISMPAEY